MGAWVDEDRSSEHNVENDGNSVDSWWWWWKGRKENDSEQGCCLECDAFSITLVTVPRFVVIPK